MDKHLRDILVLPELSMVPDGVFFKNGTVFNLSIWILLFLTILFLKCEQDYFIN